MKKWVISILFVLVILMCGVASAANGEASSYATAGIMPTATGIVVGNVWSETTAAPPAFYWSGTLPAPSSSGPFGYSSEEPTCLYVTDAFDPGDRFAVYDSGSLIGTTPAVSIYDLVPEIGNPVLTFADSRFSHATFDMAPGRHEISFTTVAGFPGGRGYLMVQPGTCGIPAPEFPSALMPAAMIISILGTVLYIKRTREN
jgi:hypothetical protein